MPPSASDSGSAADSAAPSRTRGSEPEPLLTKDQELQTEEPEKTHERPEKTHERNEELEDVEILPAPTPTHSAPAAARHQAPQAIPEAIRHQISPLSLGAGIMLMGLGIGFLGIRLRRR